MGGDCKSLNETYIRKHHSPQEFILSLFLCSCGPISPIIYLTTDKHKSQFSARLSLFTTVFDTPIDSITQAVRAGEECG